MVVIFLSLTAVCALLTTFEFIIATLAIFSFRSALRGFWLFKLHRRKELPLKVFTKPYQSIALETIGLLIGAWFALFVTLTEYRLEERVFPDPSRPPVSSQYCTFMNSTYSELVTDAAQPPSHFFVDSLSLDVSEQRECPHGIDYLDFGTVISGSLQTDSVLMPRCVPASRAIVPADVPELTFNVTNTDQVEFYMEYSTAYIVPYTMPSVGFSRPVEVDGSKVAPPVIPECEARNISSVITVSKPFWRIRDVDDHNVSRSLLQRLCRAANFTSLTKEFLKPNKCVDFGEVNTECLRTYILNNSQGTSLTYSVTFDNVSALVMQRNGSFDDGTQFHSFATACVDASVRYEYVMVSNGAAKQVGMDKKGLNKDHSFVFPLSVQVISGTCERIMPALGLSALIYSSKTEWPNFSDTPLNNRLRRLSRQRRFHAYMASIARYDFPFELLGNPRNVTRDCSFEKAVRATEVRTDAVFVLLVLSLSMCSVVIVVAAVFAVAIPKHAWKVANFAQKVTTDDLGFMAAATNCGSAKENGTGNGNGSESGSGKGEEAVAHATFKRNSPAVWSDQHATSDRMTSGNIVVTVESEADGVTNNNEEQGQRRYSLFGDSTFYKVKSFSGLSV